MKSREMFRRFREESIPIIGRAQQFLNRTSQPFGVAIWKSDSARADCLGQTSAA
jgi:hypothetical protein